MGVGTNLVSPSDLPYGQKSWVCWDHPNFKDSLHHLTSALRRDRAAQDMDLLPHRQGWHRAWLRAFTASPQVLWPSLASVTPEHLAEQTARNLGPL